MICQDANQNAHPVPSCFICQTHQEAHCFHRPIEINSSRVYEILNSGCAYCTFLIASVFIHSVLLCQKSDLYKSDDFFIVGMEDMVSFAERSRRAFVPINSNETFITDHMFCRLLSNFEHSEGKLVAVREILAERRGHYGKLFQFGKFSFVRRFN